MTPENKIKKTIIALFLKNNSEIDTSGFDFKTDEEVENLWNYLKKYDIGCDPVSEFRYGQYKTDIPCEISRNYETKSVAAKMWDGSYVGWTFFYGGGKHGEPEAIKWMEYAYDVDLKEEVVSKIERTFTKK